MAELKKKQESDALKEQSVSVQNVVTSTEKGSGPLSLNAPAITTGGRDAVSPVSSSALDLIKKKLQDSTAPATTESDLNGSIPADQIGKGPHSENGKDKVKDDNGDGNISNSSSDSDDADNGPTKEERAIQFKVSFISLIMVFVVPTFFYYTFLNLKFFTCGLPGDAQGAWGCPIFKMGEGAS